MKTHHHPCWANVLKAAGLFLLLPAAQGATVTIAPAADTTLFEAFPTNNLGAADLTSGSTLAGARSRALIQFNLEGALPRDASINSATLILNVTRQPPGGATSNYRLFRLLRSWNEGNKDGVHGAPASPGETTWNDRFAFDPAGSWATPGASEPVDFLSSTSSETAVTGALKAQFPSSSNLIADLQFWLQAPTNNYGWILISDAENVPQTVTHFGSREDLANAPALVVSFTSVSTSNEPKINYFGAVSNVFRLGFTARAQHPYTVQTLQSLQQTNWQSLAAIPAPPADTNVLVSDPISQPARFYRVRSDQ